MDSRVDKLYRLNFIALRDLYAKSVHPEKSTKTFFSGMTDPKGKSETQKINK